ncbi:MAG TPA: low molecular weight protein arginine phosphatase [Anaerolineae bacterium]|nr:low molecular weight protein arginine phosphatase [Caldilineae bacterium]HID34573.1 low molecular weight protein arginine phosphatase [Anaerolineae bacterium]
MPKNVLVVCTGNICRSPMAKALLQQALAERGLDGDIVVDSAGTYALVGRPASEGSVNAMKARGLDITDHRAKQITANLVNWADLILVMEDHHRRSIFVTWPKALIKTLLLSELAGDSAGIDDPYGREQWEYDQAADIIEGYIERGMPALLKRLKVG